MTLRIVLADDHRLVREGLAALLERETGFEIVGLAGDGATAVRLVRQLEPDILVVDMVMTGLSGVEAVRRVRAKHEHVRAVCMSTQGDRRSIVAAIDAGASAYMLKDSSCEELVQAVRNASTGNFHISPPLTALLVEEIRARQCPLATSASRHALTLREREILQLFAEDLRTQDIAERLHLSAKTVGTHRENITRKLGVRGIAGLTRYAVQEGISALSMSEPS